MKFIYKNLNCNIKELVFNDIHTMSKELEKYANEYEGYVPGRTGYNFPNKDNTYTIAYVKGDYLTKMHELRHAMYYLDSDYRKYVHEIWLSLDPNVRYLIEKFLKKCGYSDLVLIDEFQAYVFTEKTPEKFFGLKKGSFNNSFFEYKFHNNFEISKFS